MLALGVTHPAGSGLGGGGFALYYNAQDGSLTFIDFRERAPSAATPDMYKNAPEGASRVGGLATGVPGEPAGIEALVKRFGKLSLREVAAPAVSLAAGGFVVSPHLSKMFAAFKDSLTGDTVMRRWFRGRRTQAGNLNTSPALARVLRRFGAMGTRAIYHGRHANAIADAISKQGGLISAQDLADYKNCRSQTTYWSPFWLPVGHCTAPECRGVHAVTELGAFGAGHVQSA